MDVLAHWLNVQGVNIFMSYMTPSLQGRGVLRIKKMIDLLVGRGVDVWVIRILAHHRSLPLVRHSRLG